MSNKNNKFNHTIWDAMNENECFNMKKFSEIVLGKNMLK